MKTLLLCASLLTSPALAENIKMHADMTKEGSLIVTLESEATKERMTTTLSPDRTKAFFEWVSKHGNGAAPQSKAPAGCGFGDFFTGKC